MPRGDYAIEPFAADHGVAALGYALVEPERPGRFDVAIADDLGVPAGRRAGDSRRERRSSCRTAGR